MTYLIYGANGYTGELIAELARERGAKPILAGRREEAIAPIAQRLGLAHRAFSLDDPDAVARGLEGVAAVLNCAGPFSRTSPPMVDGCLRAKVHYLDITGEIEVFEGCARRDAEARAAGVMIMPGVGFDVVPSDCLAAHLKRRLPSATQLRLAFMAAGGPSRGTATTMVENLHRGGVVRRDGRLMPVPAGYKTRTIDFGRGPQKAVTIPWGDVSTAFYSTGIPNIEVYMAAPAAMRVGLKLTRPLAGLLATAPVQRVLKRRIQAGPPGPTPEQRRRGRCFLWGEATDERGGRVVSRLETPEGYQLTVLTALAVVDKVLKKEAPAGFKTPSLAYGPDFILGIEGCRRTDE